MQKKTQVLVFVSGVLALTLILTYRVVSPFLEPAAFAAILAVVVYPLHGRLLKRMNWPTTAALISTLLIVLFFAIPLTLLLSIAGNEATELASRIGENSAAAGGFMPMVTTLLDRLTQPLSRYVDLSRLDLAGRLAARLSSISAWLLETAAGALGSFVGFLGSTGITFVTLFFLLRDGTKMVDAAKAFIPLRPEQTEKLLKGVQNSIVANVYGILAVGAVQGLLTAIAMRIAGLHSVVLLGIAAAVCSAIPIIGTAIVWVPATVYLLATGQIWQGVFLGLWCAIVVGLSDNVVRPLVLAQRVPMHPLLLLFSLLGGVAAFGFLGLFFGPILISALGMIIEIFGEALRE